MYIGLDIGTSGTKAAAFDATGKMVCILQKNYDFASVQNGHRELDARRVWECAKDCLKAMRGKPYPVATITVSALGEAIVPIGGDGEPLCNAIVGTDIRGADQMRQIAVKVGQNRLARITGLNLSPIYSLNKILWMKENRPDLFEKVWKICTFQDFVIYRLCGEGAIDYSSASRTMLFDITQNNWSETILQSAGLERNLLFAPVPTGTGVGKLRRELAEELELSADIEIVTGTHDHICNALGSGVLREGWCANAVGTTEGIIAIAPRKAVIPEQVTLHQMACQPFAREGFYNTVAWSNTSGVLLKWFAQEFSPLWKEDAQQPAFDDLNRDCSPEPTDLLVLPHFSGAATPYMDSRSKGTIFGLTLSTTRHDIYKAFMEGANFELAVILDCVVKAGFQVETLVSTGGALSDALLHVKADILGKRIFTVECRQTGVLGAAMIGAVSNGDYASLTEAASAMVRFKAPVEPDERRSRKYAQRLSIYRKLYETVKEVNHQL